MPRYGHFFHLCSSPKIECFKIPLWTKRSLPASYSIQILVSEVQSEGIYYLFNRAHFGPLDMK